MYVYDPRLSHDMVFGKSDDASQTRRDLRICDNATSTRGYFPLGDPGWTLPDAATRQAQVDDCPWVTKHCKVATKPIAPPIGCYVHIDIGGEGRYPNAYNLNPSAVGTVPPWTGIPIPNLICGVGQSIPLPSGTVDVITVESTPTFMETAREIARVIKKNTGHIRLIHPTGDTPKEDHEIISTHRWVANHAGLPFPVALLEKVNLGGIAAWISRIGEFSNRLSLDYAPPYVFACYTVQAGDSLSKIAEHLLGDWSRWPDIYRLNRDEVGPDPNLIQVGRRLRIPPPPT